MTEQEQIDNMLDEFETLKEWKSSIPKHTDVGWLQIFPEMKKTFGPFIQLRLKVRKARLQVEYAMAEDMAVHELKKISIDWLQELTKDRVREKLRAIEKEIKTIDHQLQFLKTIGKTKQENQKETITQGMIERAREHPIGNLIEINNRGFTRCFNHNDTKPSAYCKKNFIWCFVCQKGWDTIAVLQQRDGMTFKEAVLTLQ